MLISTGNEQIRLLSLSASICSFTCLFIADLYHKRLHNDVTLIAIAILGMIWAGPLSTIAGACRYQEFRLWMPFFGGPRFVILQSLGWFLYSSCLTCSMVVLFNIHAAKNMGGTLTALGLLGFASTLILNTSISFFDGKAEAGGKGIVLPSIVGLRIIWNSHSIVSLLVTLGGLLCFLVADLYRSRWIAVPLLRVGAAACVLSSVITHYFNGPSEFRDYRLFQPFEGGWSFITLQGFGWMFLGVVIQCVIALPADLSHLHFDGLLSMCGIVGFFSQVTLVASLSHFQGRVKLESMEAHPPHGGTKRVRISAQLYFCLMLMLWPTLVLAGVYFLQKAYPTLKHSIDMGMVVYAAALMLFSSGPLSQVAGKTMHRNFSLWQPFEGGMVHVVSQAFGWMLYAVSLTLSAVYFCNNYHGLSPSPSSSFSPPLSYGDIYGGGRTNNGTINIEDVMRLLPVTFLSQLVIWLSILYFDSEHILKMEDRLDQHTLLGSQATREKLAAVILSLCATLIYLFVDHVSEKTMKEYKKLYIRPIIICSTFLTLLGCTVAQLAGVRMFKTFRIWQPFKGGKRFVLTQVSVWTSVGFWIVVNVVIGVSRTPALELYGLMSFLGSWGFLNTLLLIYSQGFYEDNIQNEEEKLSVSVKIPKSRTAEIMRAIRKLRQLANEDQMRRRSSSSSSTSTSTSSTKEELSSQLLDALIEQIVSISEGPVRRRSQHPGLHAEEAVNILFSLVSISLFILSDVIRGGSFPSSYNSFYLADLPFMIACASGMCSIAWTHFLCGPRRHGSDAYLMFMPFQGGFRFVTLQALGWTLFGLSVVSLSTCFFVGVSAIPLNGIIVAVGLNFFVSQLVLFLSLFLFDCQWKKSKTPTRRVAAKVFSWSDAAATAATAAKSLQQPSGKGEVINDNAIHAEAAVNADVKREKKLNMTKNATNMTTTPHVKDVEMKDTMSKHDHDDDSGDEDGETDRAQILTPLHCSSTTPAPISRSSNDSIIGSANFFGSGVFHPCCWSPSLGRRKRAESSSSADTDAAEYAEQRGTTAVCGGFFSILIGIGSLGCFAGADIATVCFGAEFPVLPARICAVLAVLTSVPLTWWLTINGIRERQRREREQAKIRTRVGRRRRRRGRTMDDEDDHLREEGDPAVGRGINASSLSSSSPLFSQSSSPFPSLQGRSACDVGLPRDGFVTMQLLGWALWSFTVLVGILFCYDVIHTSASMKQWGWTSLSGTLTGVLGITAQLLVLFSLEGSHMGSWATSRRDVQDDDVEEKLKLPRHRSLLDLALPYVYDVVVVNAKRVSQTFTRSLEGLEAPRHYFSRKSLVLQMLYAVTIICLHVLYEKLYGDDADSMGGGGGGGSMLHHYHPSASTIQRSPSTYSSSPNATSSPFLPSSFALLHWIFSSATGSSSTSSLSSLHYFSPVFEPLPYYRSCWWMQQLLNTASSPFCSSLFVIGTFLAAPALLYSLFSSAWKQAVRTVVASAAAVCEWVAVWITLPLIRLFLDWPMYYYALAWRPGAIAQDNRKVLENVRLERRVAYGDSDEGEMLDVIWPTGQSFEGKLTACKGAVLYAHGGGWVSCNSEVLLHSVTPLAREGFVVYSIDYPLSPEATYPRAVFSVLKALSWMRERDGVNEVFLLGDSAGGGLVTMAAALLENRLMLNGLLSRCCSSSSSSSTTTTSSSSSSSSSSSLSHHSYSWVNRVSFPKIERVCSVYGVLDQHSWKEWTLSAKAVQFCLSKYKGQRRRKRLGRRSPEEVKGEASVGKDRREEGESNELYDEMLDRVTLADIPSPELKNYPETLLICGHSDPLKESSRTAKRCLEEAGHRVVLREYPGVHGFLGFPIQWTLGMWKSNTAPATEDICTFFSHGPEGIDHPKKHISYPRRSVPFDWSLLVVAAALLTLGAAALGVFASALPLCVEVLGCGFQSAASSFVRLICATMANLDACLHGGLLALQQQA